MQDVPSPLAREAAAAFRAHLRRQNRALGTITKYGQQIDHFLGWLGDRSPVVVTRLEVESYLDGWCDQYEGERGRPLAPSTLKLRIDALKAFYAYLDDREQLVDGAGHALRNPLARIKPPRIKRKPNDWLREDEDRRLFVTEMSRSEGIVIDILRRLGVRTSEAAGLLIGDIDLNAGRAYFRESKTEAGVREIPISNELAFELRAWFRHLEERRLYSASTPVLTTRHGTSMKPQFIWRIVKRVGVRAGLRIVECNGRVMTEITPRTLRKTFGSHLLNNGMPLKSVSVLLGHRNTTITELVYAELLPTTIEVQFRQIAD